MQVWIDEKAGYCSGVVKAIGAAEAELTRSGQLFCLGDIVHNTAEVERLKQRGLEVIDHERLRTLHGCKVLIRAHGEPPSTYAVAQAQHITLIDATCPIVLGLQIRVRKGYEAMQRVGGQVVIFGKPGHAEVVGLSGQCDNKAIIVSHADQLGDIDFTRPIRLFSQTTKSREEYKQLIDNIHAHTTEQHDFVAYDTICRRVAGRTRELEQFARSVEVLLFVAGTGSSNGRYLFEYCRSVQPNTHFISDASELQSEWFNGVEHVGISGATSTPRWLMEDIKTHIQ